MIDRTVLGLMIRSVPIFGVDRRPLRPGSGLWCHFSPAMSPCPEASTDHPPFAILTSADESGQSDTCKRCRIAHVIFIDIFGTSRCYGLDLSSEALYQTMARA